MMDKRLSELLAGYVDGELSDLQKAEFERELEGNEELRAELEEFNKLKEVTGKMNYADLPDAVWDSYWQSLYKKMERGIGWMLFSVGAIVLLLMGMYEGFSELYADPQAPLWLKISLTALCSGLIFLLVSFSRERLFARKHERYTEVMK